MAREGHGAGAGSQGWRGKGWDGGTETSLRAQETFRWDLKSGCCDVFAGLSPKTLAASAASLASGGPASAPSLCSYFVLF